MVSSEAVRPGKRGFDGSGDRRATAPENDTVRIRTKMELSPEAAARFRVQRYDAKAVIDGVVRVPLRRFNDEGGAMTELMRVDEPRPEGLEGFRMAQMNYSVLQPGVVKAFHVHREQTDVWFVPPEDRVLLQLSDVRADSKTVGHHVRWMLGDGRTEFVRIPPGVAHGCRNVGDRPARIIYLTDRTFTPDPETCDEGRLPWNFLGDDAWDITWE